MNVGELKEALNEFPDDLEILTARDEEGNGYNHMHYFPSIVYISKNADKHGYVETVYSEIDIKDPDDEDFDGWDHIDKNNVEPRLVIG